MASGAPFEERGQKGKVVLETHIDNFAAGDGAQRLHDAGGLQRPWIGAYSGQHYLWRPATDAVDKGADRKPGQSPVPQ